MGDDTVQAAIAGTGRNDNHLFLCFGQRLRWSLHQRIVIRKKSAKLVGSVSQHQKYVGHEARFLLHGQHGFPNIIGNIIQSVRKFEPTDRCSHKGSFFILK